MIFCCNLSFKLLLLFFHFSVRGSGADQNTLCFSEYNKDEELGMSLLKKIEFKQLFSETHDLERYLPICHVYAPSSEAEIIIFSEESL